MIVSEISQKLNIPRHYIDYWKKIDLISDQRDFQYEDLVKIKFIHQCRKNGASLQAIRTYISKTRDRDNRWYNNFHVNRSGTMLHISKSDPFPLEPDTKQFYFHYGKENNIQSAFVDLDSRRVFANDNSDNTDNFIYDSAYIAALKNGNISRLITILDDFVKTNPKSLSAWIELGNLNYESKKYDKSRICYEIVLGIQPDCVEALYNLANIYLREKKHAVSIRFYRKCIQIDPDFPETYYNLGLLLLSLNYKNQAIECMEEYCRLDPDSQWGLQAAQLLEDLQQKEIYKSDRSPKNELLLFPTRG